MIKTKKYIKLAILASFINIFSSYISFSILKNLDLNNNPIIFLLFSLAIFTITIYIFRKIKKYFFIFYLYIFSNYLIIFITFIGVFILSYKYQIYEFILSTQKPIDIIIEHKHFNLINSGELGRIALLFLIFNTFLFIFIKIFHFGYLYVVNKNSSK
jgi:hypothetical protein